MRRHVSNGNLHIQRSQRSQKITKSRRAFFALFATAIFSLPINAAEKKPLKIISPDLVIESVEQGAFFDDPKIDPLKFKPLNVVPQPHSFMFGWRMKVKTERTSILVQERSIDDKGKQALPFHAVPQHGYIYNATDIVANFPPGKYSKTVYVENKPVAQLSFIVSSPKANSK